MEGIILVIIVLGLLYFNYIYLSRNKYSQTCPYCGKKARQTGKLIERKTGRPVYFYKCTCGHDWMSHKLGD